jgi:hypothetical protein
VLRTATYWTLEFGKLECINKTIMLSAKIDSTSILHKTMTFVLVMDQTKLEKLPSFNQPVGRIHKGVEFTDELSPLRTKIKIR